METAPNNDETAIAYAIMKDMLDGMTISAAIKKQHIDSQKFYDVLNKYPKVAIDYARCRELKADLLADETIHIADTEENPAKANNQIKARQWLASKTAPRQYGERIDLNVSQTLDIAGTLALARDRMRLASDSSVVPLSQVIDSTAVHVVEPLDNRSNERTYTGQVPDIFD